MCEKKREGITTMSTSSLQPADLGGQRVEVGGVKDLAVFAKPEHGHGSSPQE